MTRQSRQKMADLLQSYHRDKIAKGMENRKFLDTVFTISRGEERPRIICLCGSTRFSAAFQDANFSLTLQGYIVLSIGCDTKSDDGLGLTEEQKKKLDALHLKKIELADEVLILDVDGYIGDSTRRELEYAISLKKEVKFLSNETK